LIIIHPKGGFGAALLKNRERGGATALAATGTCLKFRIFLKIISIFGIVKKHSKVHAKITQESLRKSVCPYFMRLEMGKPCFETELFL